MTEPIQPIRVFISHTHEDKGLADALNTALVSLFDRDVVRVSYSSKKHEAGAPRGGENWFEWIVEQVKDTTVAFVLLTPASISKPWVLWEAGAVQGVAFGDASGGGDRVLPLSYALKAADVPTPFQAFQVSAGDDHPDMKKVFRELINAHLPRERIFDAVDRLPDVLDQYMKDVALTLRNAPMLPTEPVVQEWLLRLDELRGQGREELESARDVYREGLANSTRSYYLADLLGQVLLALCDRDGAREAYAQATRILEEGSDRGIWVHATAATAAIVDGREDDGLAELRRVRHFNPGADELSSIERGLVRLRTGLRADGAAFARWCAALRGRET